MVKNEMTIVDTVVITDSFDDSIPSGFLPLLLSFAQQYDMFDIFHHLNFPSKTVKYSKLDMIKTLIAAIACGCAYIKDINYKLRPYKATARLIGLTEGFPEQSLVNRFLRAFDYLTLSEMSLIFEEVVKLFSSRQKIDIFDYDATGFVA